MKKIACFVMAIVIAMSCLVSVGCSNKEAETITITDMAGVQVQIPKEPKKVVAVSPSTGDLMIAFGLGGLLDGTYYSTLNNPWANEIYPESKDFYGYDYDNSFETFVLRGVDLIFIPEPSVAETLREHGLNAICVRQFAESGYDDYVFYFSEIIRQIWGDIDGVSTKIDSWQQDFTTAIDTVKNILAENPQPKRTLYYINGEKDRGLGYTDLGKSLLETVYGALNIDFICNRFSSNRPSVEAVLSINPDLIVIGGIYQKKRLSELLVTTDNAWNGLTAVQNNQIHNIPVGFVGFEQTAAESSLFIYSQANQLYPELFNFDLVKLTQDNLKKYFNYDLSELDAWNMLNGLYKNGALLIS